MVRTQLILLLTVLSLVKYVQSPLGIVCSTFCNTGGCTGWSMMECGGQCFGGWNYNSIISTCDVTNSSTVNKTVMTYSDDIGGDISVSNDLGDGCNVGGMTYYYGKYKSSQVITASLGIGTYIPHYAIDVYFNLLFIDIQASGDSKWDNTVTVFAKLLNLTNSTNDQKLNKSLNVGGGGSSGSTNQGKAECGSTSQDDKYYRMLFGTYKHYETGTAINLEIQIKNSKNSAVWNIKEIIYVAYICHIYCLSCYNKNYTQCYSCDVSQGYMLSNNTCYNTCLFGFGYTTDPGVCVYCSKYCATCYNLADNCSKCYSTSTNASFLQYSNITSYDQCVVTCVGAFFGNTTTRVCDPCNLNCTSCVKTANICTACVIGYGWYNYTCFMPCLDGFYFTNNNTNCSACPTVCATCTDFTTCTLCRTTSPITYLYNGYCYAPCPPGFYGTTNSSGANICVGCSSACAICTSNPSPCSKCNTGYYLYMNVCSSTCPSGYIPYVGTNECLLCDQICVGLTINMYFPSSTNSELYIDMTYSLDLDFTTFNWQTFQTVQITNNDINSFDITYTLTGTNSYRLILKPKGFIFLYNQTVTVTTQEPPSTIDTSISSIPFKTTNYLKTAQIKWFLLQPPNLSTLQNTIIQGFAGANGILSNATATPFIAQIKKSGVFGLLFSGAHITSCTIFVNSVPPQNLYEGARFWALSTFYDVPVWQQKSDHPNNVFGSQMYNLTYPQRRLFDLQTLPWRFQRTGMTSFFIYDVYIPILLMVVVWILGIVGRVLRKHYKSLKQYQPKFFTALHKIHQFAILYVTTAMILEWMFFDAGSTQRWISLLVCIIFTVYFVGYHLYIYYDMIRYPQAMIGNEKYEKYVTRYSTFLKNMRFEEYDMNQPWSWRHWFRPYNYHILGYYKKFCMIIAFPLFYESPRWLSSIMMILQLLQIIRFCFTRPYQARWRTIFRFCLQFFLLTLFTVVFANCFMMQKIVLNDSDVLYYVNIYYNLGWLGFVMIWLFNLGFVVLAIIDTVQGFRKTSREMMDQARRVYYYNKITDYQKEFDKVPLGLMNRWVKLGNLNDRNQSELPDINVRLEYYKLIRHKEYYDVDVLKAVELFMNTDFNFHKENNTTPGKLIRKKVKLSKDVSSTLYRLIDHLYNTYAKKDTEAIVIKTFMIVKQKEFKAGDRVPLLPHTMFQKIQLQNFSGDKEMISLKQKLTGFPLNAHDLQSI